MYVLKEIGYLAVSTKAQVACSLTCRQTPSIAMALLDLHLRNQRPNSTCGAQTSHNPVELLDRHAISSFSLLLIQRDRLQRPRPSRCSPFWVPSQRNSMYSTGYCITTNQPVVRTCVFRKVCTVHPNPCTIRSEHMLFDGLDQQLKGARRTRNWSNRISWCLFTLNLFPVAIGANISRSTFSRHTGQPLSGGLRLR